MSTKKPKKKLMVVKNYPGSGNYPPSTVGFAFLSPPEADGDRYQSCPYATCREGLISMLQAAYGNGGKYNVESQHVVDLDRMRLVAIPPKVESDKDREDKKKRLFKIKSVLNMYEEYAGFPSTKIATVKHDLTNYAWLFTGGREKGWLKSPELFTYACLLIRLSLNLKEKVLDDLVASDDVNDFAKKVIKYATEEKKYSSDTPNSTSRLHLVSMNGYHDLVVYLRESCEKILLIMKYHDKLFEGIEPIPMVQNDKWRWNAGISSVANMNTYSDVLNDRLKKLYKDGKL